MRKTTPSSLVVFLLLILLSCKKDDASTDVPKKEPKVDSNGLTKDINELVPKAILDEMKKLGMPINGGENPPQLENRYFGSAMILKKSNRPSDFPGMSFADFDVTFYEQNNEQLTIKVDYLNGPETGKGVGSFIVGEGCSFSVFVRFDAKHTDGSLAVGTYVMSGTLTSNGIENLYLANFMIDNNGNPTKAWIENGEGRVIYDSDGFSPIKGYQAPKGTFAADFASLPDCPCTYAEAKKMIGKTDCPAGEWRDCDGGSQTFHFGATDEVRWTPAKEGAAGQQCTYDQLGNLITGGIAAGSPDLVAPQNACDYPEWVVNLGVEFLCKGNAHCEKDVIPWEKKPCWEYLRDWPANRGPMVNGKYCAEENIVSGIDHMRALIGNMTCEQATVLISEAKKAKADQIDDGLKSYILNLEGKPALGRSELKRRVQRWKDTICEDEDEDICKVLTMAITNL